MKETKIERNKRHLVEEMESLNKKRSFIRIDIEHLADEIKHQEVRIGKKKLDEDKTNDITIMNKLDAQMAKYFDKLEDIDNKIRHCERSMEEVRKEEFYSMFPKVSILARLRNALAKFFNWVVCCFKTTDKIIVDMEEGIAEAKQQASSSRVHWDINEDTLIENPMFDPNKQTQHTEASYMNFRGRQTFFNGGLFPHADSTPTFGRSRSNSK